MQVSVSADGKHVWGIDSDNKIFYRNDVENNNWTLVDGSLKYISVSGDGSHVWGTDSNNNIYIEMVKMILRDGRNRR